MSARSAARRTPIQIRPRTLARSAILGLAALTGTLAAMPQASAQFYFDSRDIFDDADVLISPRAVAARLQSRGFHELTRPRFDGTAYVIDATSPTGNRVRLFVDARSGAMLGRRPLDTAYYPAARPERARPGYGWTEDDASGRQARLQGDLVPPASIPDVVPPPPARSGAIDANPQGINPQGINPDGRVRPAAPAPKKSAKLNQPAKPPVARVAPVAPAPKIEAAEPAKVEAAKPEPTHEQSPATAAVEPAKPASPVTPAASEPVLPTPAANQEPAKAEAPKAEPAPEPAKAEAPKADPAPEPAKAEAPKADPAPATEAKLETKKSDGWQEPPPVDEAKRKVRVIGGATMVPGGSNETQPAN